MLESSLTILALLPFYLIGAFPSGMLLARLKGINISEHGSGNVGATNVSRVLGKKSGLLTLAIDIAKGMIAIAIATTLGLSQSMQAYAAVVVVAGHCFSIPGKLRGGKGVATSLGVLLALNPIVALLTIIAFAVIFAVSRIVSMASVGAALFAPISAFLLSTTEEFAAAITVVSAIVIFRHRENLQRIAEGRENRFR